jgi:tellurite resistance protein TehA-like permease
MEKKNLIWIILISVIVIVIASFLIPLVVKVPQPGPGQNLPLQGVPSDPQSSLSSGQGDSMQLKTAISFINIGLIIPLLFIYAGIYRNLRSSFTLGLLAVIFALGMYAVTSNPLLVSLMGGHPNDIGLFQIIPDLCTTIALVILIRISLE